MHFRLFMTQVRVTHGVVVWLWLDVAGHSVVGFIAGRRGTRDSRPRGVPRPKPRCCAALCCVPCRSTTATMTAPTTRSCAPLTLCLTQMSTRQTTWQQRSVRSSASAQQTQRSAQQRCASCWRKTCPAATASEHSAQAAAGARSGRAGALVWRGSSARGEADRLAAAAGHSVEQTCLICRCERFRCEGCGLLWGSRSSSRVGCDAPRHAGVCCGSSVPTELLLRGCGLRAC